MSDTIRLVATVCFALALPVFLITSAVRTVAASEDFYEREFAKYRVGEVVGFTAEELSSVAEAFIRYFNARPGRIEATLPARLGGGPVFNEREVQHMVDVQQIMHRVFQATWLALAAMLVAAAAIILADVRSGVLALLQAIAIGGVTTVVVVSFVALVSLVAFDRLFLLFHFVSFTNDLWLLDPRTDRMIQLFPQAFFFDAAIQIGLRAAGIGAAMAAVSIIGLRVLR